MYYTLKYHSKKWERVLSEEASYAMEEAGPASQRGTWNKLQAMPSGMPIITSLLSAPPVTRFFASAQLLHSTLSAWSWMEWSGTVPLRAQSRTFHAAGYIVNQVNESRLMFINIWYKMSPSRTLTAWCDTCHWRQLPART